jgi:hypothetical protein
MLSEVDFMTNVRNAIIRSVGIHIYWSWEVSNGRTVSSDEIQKLGFRGDFDGGLLFSVNGELHKGEVLIVKRSGTDHYSLYIGNVRFGIFVASLYEHKINDCDLGFHIDGRVAYDHEKSLEDSPVTV